MPEYKTMPPFFVKVSHFNPERRINRETLTGLLLSIQKHGILEPLALAYDCTLADGHRRLQCAKLLSLPEVPVAIYHEHQLDAATLWVVLNSETMNLSPSQWLAAVDAGLALDTPGFPDRLKRRIVLLQEMVGAEGIALLVEGGRSPFILDNAQRVQKYCDRRGDDVFLRLAVKWLSSVGNSFSVRAAMSEEIPPDILMEAIEEGSELRRVWDVARD